MNVPYTTKTGLKIGSRYLEKGTNIPIDDPDMLFLQEALLSTPQYRKSRRIERFAWFFCISGILFIVFFKFIFR
jgi:hypothetical protein